MNVKKNKNNVSNKEKKIKNIPEGDHIVDVKKNKNIVSKIVKKIKYSIYKIEDYNTHLQVGGLISNPIDVENFNSGERGRHRNLPIVVDTEDSEEGGREDPIPVYEIESTVRQKADDRNQPIPVEDDDDDDDDDLLRIAIMVSLAEMDDPKGRRPVQAIDSYVDAFDCEYVGQSSYSRKSEMVDCGICMEEVFKHEMFKIMGCAHRYCASCVSLYIAAKLDDGLVNIGCVDPQCKDGFLLPEECKMILPRGVYSRWGDKLCESMLMEGTKLYCPFKDCSGLLINEGDENGHVITKSVCPHCHRLLCAQCRVPWHAGFSCKDYQKLGNDEREAEDLQLMRVAKKRKWQRCPKCKYFVERINGCRHIECR
ncbi:hypothetical protein J5N97_021764 [Dioscorea zingiberensis]|uniref:RBR-type E3 ubiquitin transferase n=1 Tax=Dioscorea zingiberensis TaxID=325984 RepID=A0A9D5C8X8_9LILI|nr:hypothetical protein J5N97_021764 [Dioscorea zingiberensis]